MKLNINNTIIEIADEDLQKAITDKVDYIHKADELVIKSKTDFDSYTDNIKSESIKAGSEIGRKELFKSLELDIEGTGTHTDATKSADFLRKWSKESIDTAIKDAGIEPDKKLKEALADIEALRAKGTDYEANLKAANDKHTNYIKDQNKVNKLRGLIPQNSLLPVDDMVMLLGNKLKIDSDENGVFFGIGEDGQPIKDENRNLKTVDSLVTSFFDNNTQYLNGSSGGAGGGDSGGNRGGKQSMADFIESQSKLGIKQGSTEFNEAMYKASDAGTLE